MKKLLLLVPAAILLAAPLANAAGYGAAGCGLGSMVFGNKPGVMQILAATTNGTFASQTFGITTGTSNCDGSLLGGAGAKVFIEANKEALAKDIARGQGETLTNLSQLAGCQDASAVGSSLQKKFDTLFPAGAPAAQVSDSIVGALKGSPQLSCSKLG
jgi:hypothetical protein